MTTATHEGVSCDTCMKNNFTGRRYKCLICYDFDLCSTCYESGASNNQHLNTHPMQCILTKADYELYYGGETSVEPQSFTCPYCGKLGFNETTLSEHVTIEHEDDTHEVVCPICAAIPTGDPNHLTEDLLNHINLEHRNTRDSSSNDDTTNNRFSRRLGSRTNTGRRGGRNTFQFGSASAAAAAALVGHGGRDGMDPIAELLSQLSGVRRAVAHTSTLQLQQLQAHLREREKEHLQQTRQQTSSNIFTQQPKTGAGTKPTTTTSTGTTTTSSSNSNNSQTNTLMSQILDLPNVFETLNTSRDNRYLLSRYDSNNQTTKSSTSNNKEQNSTPSINQSFFIHDILLSTLMNQIENDDSSAT